MMAVVRQAHHERIQNRLPTEPDNFQVLCFSSFWEFPVTLTKTTSQSRSTQESPSRCVGLGNVRVGSGLQQQAGHDSVWELSGR